MEDETIHFTRSEARPPSQSRIFNTSVRGWIALIMAVCLAVAVLLVVLAPFFGVVISDGIATTMTTLFATGFTGAITYYFQQASKEGQNPKLPPLPGPMPK